MNKNILIAATVSLAFHGTLALYSFLQHHVPASVSTPQADKPIVFTMPVIPPDPPEPDPLDSEHQAGPQDYSPAPPSLPSTETPATSPFADPPRLNPPGPIVDVPVIPVNVPTGHDGMGPGTIFTLDSLSRQPEATVEFPPNYPFELRRNGIEGKVLVSFVVDAHGYVHNAVAEEGPHPEFASAAAAAVSKWRFRPGIKDGVAVATRMQIPVLFNLDPKP